MCCPSRSEQHNDTNGVPTASYPAGLVATRTASRESVIGGAPAAAVVFAGEVRKKAEAMGGDAEHHTLVTKELAQRFDKIHSVQRAKDVGSIDDIITPNTLRAFLVERIAEDYHRSVES